MCTFNCCLFIAGVNKARNMLATVRTSRLAAAAAASNRPTRTTVVVDYRNEKRHAPLIDRLGGPEAVKTAVDIFYGKVCFTSNTTSSSSSHLHQQQ
jgi:hypothetical protein